MKKKFVKLILLIFSLASYSQGITSIYSFEVENPVNVQTIVNEMTKHFKTDFARTNSSKEFQEINQLLTPLIKENSQTLLKNLVGGKGQGNTGVTMVFVMKVNNPMEYMDAYKNLISTMEENGKSKLFTEYGLSEVFAGGQNDLGSTHHAIIGAVDMVSLVNGLDELFSSQEFRIFASKVSKNRTILSRKTVFTLASFND
jgi:hypothetical protein